MTKIYGPGATTINVLLCRIHFVGYVWPWPLRYRPGSQCDTHYVRLFINPSINDEGMYRTRNSDGRYCNNLSPNLGGETFTLKKCDFDKTPHSYNWKRTKKRFSNKTKSLAYHTFNKREADHNTYFYGVFFVFFFFFFLFSFFYFSFTPCVVLNDIHCMSLFHLGIVKLSLKIVTDEGI